MLKKETGATEATGVTLENIEKPLINFSHPRPQKPLNCLKKLSPSPKTIEGFKKPPPSLSPVTGGGNNKGTPSFNVPFRPL